MKNIAAAHPNAVNCVKGEIHNVLSMMRVNQRWASGERFVREVPLHTESPLLRAFKILTEDLEECTDLNDFDTLNYLTPFLRILESEKTNGIITGVAVSSLNKFLLYDFVTVESPRAKEAINGIALAVSRCRFEETHRETDEMVLMKLLELLEYCLRCSAGSLITGMNVWRMVQTCYRISQQPRSSLHLVHTAENTLAHLILTIFNRISDLEDDDILYSERMPMSPRDNPLPPLPNSPGVNSLTSPMSDSALRPYGISILCKILQFLSSLINPIENDESTRILGLSLINIVLETAGTNLGEHKSLVSNMQSDLSKYLLQNSETNDITILSLTLRVVFNLFTSIKDHLKVQLEVFFTSVHMRIIDSFSCSMEQKEIAMESLVEFCREPALMLDLYINYDCDVHCTNLFEVLCKSLAKHAFHNMDEPNPEAEDNYPMSPSASRRSFNGQNLNIINLLAMEGLLAVIESIAKRCSYSSKNNIAKGLKGTDLSQFALPVESHHSNAPMSSVSDVMQLVMNEEASEMSDSSSDTGLPPMEWLQTARERTAEVLQQRKKTKKRLMLAAEKFNTDRKGWINYAEQLGLLPTPATAEAVARFLLHTPGLDKTKVGDYLGDGPIEKYPFNAEVKNAYVGLFDFHGLSIDAALRLFLEKFRLPGEAQKIDRMMEAFSKHFYDHSQDSPLANADTAFILSFSIIMLNTDLHNDQIQKKMTMEEFIRNNRGINDGKDIELEYLQTLYRNILENEIQMQSDLNDISNQGSTAIQWDGILKRQQNVVSASFTSNASIKQLKAGLYEREMFKLIAESTIKSISMAFEQTSNASTMDKAIRGLQNCAKIAVYFDLLDILNQIIRSLCQYFLQFARHVLSGAFLLAESHVDLISVPATSLSSSSVMSDDPPPTLSEDELQTKRALETLKLVFSLMNNHGNHIRDAWADVVECILTLNELDVLPTSLVEMDDFVDARGVPLVSSGTEEGNVNAASSLSKRHAPSHSNGGATGMSGRVRERTRRRAEYRAAIKSKRQEAMSTSSSSNLKIWDSLSSFLFAEEENEDDASALIHAVFHPYVLQCGLEREAWLKFCKQLSDVSLQELIKALIDVRDPVRYQKRTAPLPPQHQAIDLLDPMFQENAVFALELSINAALANKVRIPGCWALLHEYFERLLSDMSVQMDLLMERLVVNILRVCIHHFHEKSLNTQLIASLRLLLDLNLKAGGISLLVERLEMGLFSLLKANAIFMNSVCENSSAWSVIFELLVEVYKHTLQPNQQTQSLDILSFLQENHHISSLNFHMWMGFIQSILRTSDANVLPAARNDVNDRKKRVLHLLHAYAVELASTMSEEEDQIVQVNNMWSTILLTLKAYLQHPFIGLTAWNCFHSTFVSPNPMITSDTWDKCFNELLFPLKQMLVSENASPRQLHEIRLRYSQLLSKAFLHHGMKLVELPTFPQLWQNVLHHLAQDLRVKEQSNAGDEDEILYETSFQSLNNILMVMTAEGLFQQPNLNPTPGALLHSTTSVLQAECPQILQQISILQAPPPSQENVPPQPGAAPASPAMTSPDSEAISSASLELKQDVPPASPISAAPEAPPEEQTTADNPVPASIQSTQSELPQEFIEKYENYAV